MISLITPLTTRCSPLLASVTSLALTIGASSVTTSPHSEQVLVTVTLPFLYLYWSSYKWPKTGRVTVFSSLAGFPPSVK